MIMNNACSHDVQLIKQQAPISLDDIKVVYDTSRTERQQLINLIGEFRDVKS